MIKSHSPAFLLICLKGDMYPHLFSPSNLSLPTSILSRNLFLHITTISCLSSTIYLIPSIIFDSSSTTPSLHHYVIRSNYSWANERVKRQICDLLAHCSPPWRILRRNPLSPHLSLVLSMDPKEHLPLWSYSHARYVPLFLNMTKATSAHLQVTLIQFVKRNPFVVIYRKACHSIQKRRERRERNKNDIEKGRLRSSSMSTVHEVKNLSVDTEQSTFSRVYSPIEMPKPVLKQHNEVWWKDTRSPKEDSASIIRSIQEVAFNRTHGGKV